MHNDLIVVPIHKIQSLKEWNTPKKRYSATKKSDTEFSKLYEDLKKGVNKNG
jgi:hypothetical protein